MRLTDIQKKYYAWDLSHRKSTGDDSRFTGVLSEARVDLNPHQVEAALFAFKSPLSKGAILADEVGLGKTIEAGIILSQFWAEHKRRILIIVPASLRSQWNIELMDKFYLPSCIINGPIYDELIRQNKKPFIQDSIIICSYHFAASHAEEIRLAGWDLVTLDEAHKLRNVYKPGNKMANAIRRSILPFKKILLTATPLQNNLKELYGLISIIDSDYFSTLDNFSESYNAITTRDESKYGELRHRLGRIVHRTLRRQVSEYVKYTKRSALVQDFYPDTKENEIYSRMSDYLEDPFAIGLPEIGRPLVIMVIRKVMASSSYALSYTLEKIISRLEKYKLTGELDRFLPSIEDDFETSDDENNSFDSIEGDVPCECPSKTIDEEIDLLRKIQKDARSIGAESKAAALLKALDVGFGRMAAVGAQRKALVFTESRRTQEYLKNFLEANGYEGRIVCFNGTNNGPEAKAIYNMWCKEHKGTDRVSGDRAIDTKQALTEYFRDYADIMIATEAGAEGINLQFCSMVVNYDMPWNPQRIEQRIGRCHRYGQKHDVVVINFVNRSNVADCRVYDLLNDKLNLFDGVFGCSDEILGAIESDIDFERRLCDIYQNCRTEETINEAFDRLQAELESVIASKMNDTRRTLLDHFDEDVIAKLRDRRAKDSIRIDGYNRHLWEIAKAILGNRAIEIDEANYSFRLVDAPNGIQEGSYSLKKEVDAIQLRAGCPLGQYVISNGLSLHPVPQDITFSLSGYPYHSATLERFLMQEGYCVGFRVESFNERDGEEELFICGVSDDGEITPDDFGKKLLELPVQTSCPLDFPKAVQSELEACFEEELSNYKAALKDRTQQYINEEVDALYDWADENMYPIENEVIRLRKELESNRRASKKAVKIEEKLELKKTETTLRKALAEKQAKFDELRDYYDRKSEEQIESLTKAMDSTVQSDVLFLFRWKII